MNKSGRSFCVEAAFPNRNNILCERFAQIFVSSWFWTEFSKILGSTKSMRSPKLKHHLGVEVESGFRRVSSEDLLVEH